MTRERHFMDIPILIVFILAVLVFVFGVILSDKRFCMTLDGDIIDELDKGEKCFPSLIKLRNYSEYMAKKYNVSDDKYTNMYTSGNLYLNNTQ